MKNTALFFKTAIVRVALFTAIIAGAASCSDSPKPENTKEVAEEHNDAKFSADKEKDAQFVVNATEINLEEIELARLAQQRGVTAEVKDLAKMIEQMHTQSQGELTGLAKTKVITIPVAITDKGKEAVKTLDGKTGVKFDKEYCDMLVNNHKDAITKYEKEAAESNDVDIKNWVNATLVTLRTHLDKAITCQKKCDKL
jgi:putative membrane protein